MNSFKFYITFSLGKNFYLFESVYRENSVGPSVYTEYVDEVKRPLVKSGPLPDSELDPLSNKNNHL